MKLVWEKRMAQESWSRYTGVGRMPHPFLQLKELESLCPPILPNVPYIILYYFKNKKKQILLDDKISTNNETLINYSIKEK